MRCDNVDQTEYGVAVSYRNNDSGSCNRRRKFCSGCANEHSQRVQDARTYQAGCANVVIDARTHAYCSPGLFLLAWINCNPSIASSLPYIHYKVWHSRRSLAMATYFHPTLYIRNAITCPCWDNSYSMLVKRAPRVNAFFYSLCYGVTTVYVITTYD